MPDEPEKLLKVKDAARILNVSTRTIWRLVDNDAIKCVRIGRCARFRVQDLQQIIKDGYYTVKIPK